MPFSLAKSIVITEYFRSQGIAILSPRLLCSNGLQSKADVPIFLGKHDVIVAVLLASTHQNCAVKARDCAL